MHFEGSVAINASREKVWAFVIDPDQVGQCGPGVEKIEVIDATHFKATAKVGIGFISARFNVNMELAETERARPRADQGSRSGAWQRGRRDGADAPLGRRGRRDRHGLVGGRQSVRHARERRRADDRRHGQQDDRPDLRVHEDQARGLTAASSMERLTRVVGPVATNVHVLADARTREAIAIDTATPSLAWITESWPRATGRSS